MIRAAGALLLAAVAAAAQPDKPPIVRTAVVQAAAPTQAAPPPARVTRASIVAVEQLFDGKIRKASAADPMEIMSSTQGVYLDGFGVVLTAQVDLILTPMPTPFRLSMSKADIARVRARKADHLPLLRQLMQQTMLEAAANLAALPPNEQVVLAVSLFRLNWEDTTGLPAQILMQAPRQKLLERAAALNAIQVQEF